MRRKRNVKVKVGRNSIVGLGYTFGIRLRPGLLPGRMSELMSETGIRRGRFPLRSLERQGASLKSSCTRPARPSALGSSRGSGGAYHTGVGVFAYFNWKRRAHDEASDSDSNNSNSKRKCNCQDESIEHTASNFFIVGTRVLLQKN